MSARKKEFVIPKLYRGVQLNLRGVFNSAAYAASRFGITPHQLKTYGNVTVPHTKECIDNFGDVYASVDGGEIVHYDKKNFNRLDTYQQWKNYIDEYRKVYPTYQDLLKSRDEL